MLHWSIVTHVRHGGSQTRAMEGTFVPHAVRQERRGVPESGIFRKIYSLVL